MTKPIANVALTAIVSLAALAGCGSDSTEHRPVAAMRYAADPHDRAWGEGTAKAGHFSIEVAWNLSQHAATIAFTRPNGTPAADVSDVVVRLKMPAHSHEGFYATVIAMPRADGSGVVDVTHLAPTMPGEWLLEVSATVAGARDKAALTVNLPHDVKVPASDAPHAH